MLLEAAGAVEEICLSLKPIYPKQIWNWKYKTGPFQGLSVWWGLKAVPNSARPFGRIRLGNVRPGKV